MRSNVSWPASFLSSIYIIEVNSFSSVDPFVDSNIFSCAINTLINPLRSWSNPIGIVTVGKYEVLITVLEAHGFSERQRYLISLKSYIEAKIVVPIVYCFQEYLGGELG
jgi:hypothetical protein